MKGWTRVKEVTGEILVERGMRLILVERGMRMKG